jgi:LAO/AO transport system kinase
MLEAADLALLNELMNVPSHKQRRALAKVITLLESTRLDHRKRADEILNALLPKTGKSFRIGISGVPGVGKSTLIEALGLYLIEKGHRIAVLAIDPSSSLSGGSILGDKTRMERLSVLENAFIRPSPSSLTLGGVAEKTRESMLVTEAAGFDIIIVETVGVGQSEISVADMTDVFVLMQLPNAGDDLQAIKKGVMEIADLIVINKVDLDPDAAMRAQLFITSSIRLLGFQGNPDHASHDESSWHPKAITLSALEGKGISELWDKLSQFEKLQKANGKFDSRRKQQASAWMWDRIDAGLKNAFRSNQAVQKLLPSLIAQVNQGTMAPSVAARRLLESMGHEFF